MNHVTPESKSAAIKTLAILGFVIMIILAVWTAVQIVRLIPTAFTSLAELADDVQNGKDVIVLDEETIVANSGETVTINFEGSDVEGTYTFAYACAEGLTLALILEDESKNFIACDEAVPIDAQRAVTLAVSSTENRFADVTYTIAFAPASGKAGISTEGKLTIVNNEIPAGTVAANDSENEEEAAEETPEETTPAKPVVPAKPVTTIQYVSQIPTSDPNGFTDLAIRLVTAKSIDADDDAKIQVEVKNLGTKTSKEFDVTIELPDGSEAKIGDEKGLKPNERATYTLEFDASELNGRETIEGDVDVDDDKTHANNSFRTTVRFED